ncbi:MAG: hypothetical protein ACREHD_20740 [Pirellulales bacterium]
MRIDLVNAAKQAGAKDPLWVANLAHTAVIIKGQDTADVLSQIKRSQPSAFFTDSPKTGTRYGVSLQRKK